jgi:uncharacterized protein (DUF2252 family)
MAADRRARLLERRRLRKMAKSAHAYVRGNTAKFYEWLGELNGGVGVPEGPPVWICGDCHLGNLGPLADADDRIALQIRDLDQSVVGNPAHDLIRLALSLQSAARGSDLPGVAGAHIVEAMVEGYSRALDGEESNGEHGAPGVVRAVRKRAEARKWRHLADERIDGPRPTIPLGKRFWPLEEEERADLERLFDEEDVRKLIVSLSCRDEDERVRLIDAAYWVKGCSSLGGLRFAALAQVGSGKRRHFALVDLKEAVAALPPQACGRHTPGGDAHRVVAGAKALSPNLGERMMAVELCGRPVVLRELRPQDLKIEVNQFTRPEAVRAASYLAFVVGRAHARQMDEATRLAWRGQLNRESIGNLDAPPWLWRSVVQLAARHEAGYLEHCRRYALTR